MQNSKCFAMLDTDNPVMGRFGFDCMTSEEFSSHQHSVRLLEKVPNPWKQINADSCGVCGQIEMFILVNRNVVSDIRSEYIQIQIDSGID